jgi:putative hemolysin
MCLQFLPDIYPSALRLPRLTRSTRFAFLANEVTVFLLWTGAAEYAWKHLHFLDFIQLAGQRAYHERA